MTSPKVQGTQLELFAQDFFASLPTPAVAPAPPAPLFKAPPRVQPNPPVIVPPAQVPEAPPRRMIALGSQSVEYVLQRSARRSIGFTIDDTGLRVTAPKRLALADVDNAIRAKQRWILTKLRERGERKAKRDEQPITWVDGAKLPYLGGEITLRLETAARSHCWFDKTLNELNVGVPPGLQEWQLVERVRRWFELQAKTLFKERLDFYAPQLGVQYNQFTLTSAGTRWGSCTVERNIRLNWRLIHYPLSLVDYVVAHELAHIREMNHSPRFWAAVAEVYPDYDGAKAALKKRSAELPVVFP
ncbi:M48 family peptidase [Massilia arenosa]|uniref:M48 family peptidase n=1 Tax=Zemynaea arenosa TaxID=2561931 RepID=A0A4Y9SBV8_9BURK|nr:SprT family zinc-dependent metalloprotease [Massilia arenosa]TFW19716.1 M48 family peptidase [Massilia arenosa]